MWVSVRETRGRDQLAASAGLRWFPDGALGKVHLSASRVFSDMVCMHVNTCVLRYYGDGWSQQEACGSDLIQTERAASCWVALVQVSGGEDKKD